MTTAAPPSNPLHALTKIARRYLLFVGVLSFFLNLTLLALPIYMLQVYDRVLTSRNLSTLLMLALAALFVLVVMASLEFVRARILVRIGHWFDHALRRWLVHLALVEGRDNQAVRDLDEVRTFLAGPGLLAHLKPAVYPPRVELGHFLMIATMMPAMALLASRFSALRQRLRQTFARNRQGRCFGRAHQRRRSHDAAQIRVVPRLDATVGQAGLGKAPHGVRAQGARADEPSITLIETLDQRGFGFRPLALENGRIHAASPVKAA